ncbi:MAG TPA: LacI family DNA-binding transcriptional regulator [Terracidiphilus sp.]|nr:LacI family DNA-binding transcriptional regulator [Terracidiphilus sp.]
MAQHKSGHVTLLDVAKACELSVSTVSIVLSEAPLSQNVAPATRQKVREAAKRLGYHPDAYARSLRRRRSHTIGVLAYDLSDPFCVPLVQGIQNGVEPENYLPLLMDAQTKRELFDRYMKMILEQRAEGLIVIASWVFEETNLLADLEKNHVPIVILGRDLTHRKIGSLMVDNELGGMLAMRYLLELGHRRIAVIRGPQEMVDSEPRWAGIRRAAEAAGVKINPKLVFQLPGLANPLSGFEGGVEIAQKLLASRQTFSAVVAFDDLTALGVMRGLRGANIKVPEDCSIIGFDDVMPAALSTPGITTIRQPLEEMGLRAAKWCTDAIRAHESGKSHPVELWNSVPELIERGSTVRWTE